MGAVLPYRADARDGHCTRCVIPFGGCLKDPVTSQDVAATRKIRPVGAPSRSLFRPLDTRFATSRLVDQRIRAAVAILAAPSLDRRLAGDLVLDHGLANR